MLGKQPKQGNKKITLSIKNETYTTLKNLATSTNKRGAVIDALLQQSTCKCGAPAKFKVIETNEPVCAKCAIPEVKKALTKISEPPQ